MILVTALILSSLLMAGVWALARKINNYSIVDAAWALCFGLLTAVYAALAEGFWERKLLVLFCVGVWSLRLGIFLWRRIASHHPKEDGRYLELREGYQPQVERGFFWFFQYQAWSVVLLTVPFFLMARNEVAEISTLEWIGALVWAISLLGEALADHQAKVFKSNPANQSGVCDEGLWKYSRHPNYFFESCIWWGYFLMALGSPGGWYTVYCPLVILGLLLKVTGVPLSEKQSLKSRGDAYRKYQSRTSMFIPWFPKSVAMLAAIFLSAGSADAASPAPSPSASPAASSSPSPTPTPGPVIPADRSAKIYEMGKSSGEPLFIQKTHYEDNKDGTILAHTVITDLKGGPISDEKAIYNGKDLVSQKVDQFQISQHFETEIKNERVIYRHIELNPKPGTKVREVSEGLFDDYITGPVSEAYLALHWDEILAGKMVPCRFGVMEIRETIKFEFKLKEKQRLGDKDAVLVLMKPANVFFSLMLKPIELYVDAKTKRYLKFVGRTGLFSMVNGTLKPLDAEIIYE